MRLSILFVLFHFLHQEIFHFIPYKWTFLSIKIFNLKQISNRRCWMVIWLMPLIEGHRFKLRREDFLWNHNGRVLTIKIVEQLTRKGNRVKDLLSGTYLSLENKWAVITPQPVDCMLYSVPSCEVGFYWNYWQKQDWWPNSRRWTRQGLYGSIEPKDQMASVPIIRVDGGFDLSPLS